MGTPIIHSLYSCFHRNNLASKQHRGSNCTLAFWIPDDRSIVQEYKESCMRSSSYLVTGMIRIGEHSHISSIFPLGVGAFGGIASCTGHYCMNETWELTFYFIWNVTWLENSLFHKNIVCTTVESTYIAFNLSCKGKGAVIWRISWVWSEAHEWKHRLLMHVPSVWEVMYTSSLPWVCYFKSSVHQEPYKNSENIQPRKVSSCAFLHVLGFFVRC
jgi:hypothetical protein